MLIGCGQTYREVSLFNKQVVCGQKGYICHRASWSSCRSPGSFATPTNWHFCWLSLARLESRAAAVSVHLPVGFQPQSPPAPRSHRNLNQQWTSMVMFKQTNSVWISGSHTGIVRAKLLLQAWNRLIPVDPQQRSPERLPNILSENINFSYIHTHIYICVSYWQSR